MRIRHFLLLFLIAFTGGAVALLLEKIAELWAIAITNSAVIDSMSEMFTEAVKPLRTKIE